MVGEVAVVVLFAKVPASVVCVDSGCRDVADLGNNFGFDFFEAAAAAAVAVLAVLAFAGFDGTSGGEKSADGNGTAGIGFDIAADGGNGAAPGIDFGIVAADGGNGIGAETGGGIGCEGAVDCNFAINDIEGIGGGVALAESNDINSGKILGFNNGKLSTGSGDKNNDIGYPKFVAKRCISKYCLLCCVFNFDVAACSLNINGFDIKLFICKRNFCTIDQYVTI